MKISGVLRLDIILMVLYQMALFFAAQLVFVIYLEYMPPTHCDSTDFCYKIKGKCLSDYDRNATNLCDNQAELTECLEEKNNNYFHSAQFDYQQACTGLRYFSATTAMYIGVMFAGLLFGTLADIFGRRPIFIVSTVIGIISLITSAAIPGVLAFYISRAFVGVAVAGVQVTGWSYGSEMISTKRRFQLRTFSNWANARLLLATITFVTREWHWATYGCALFSATIIPILYYLPESPIFLEQKKKYERASKSRERIAEIQKVPYEPVEVTEKEELKSITFWQLFKIPPLRRNFFVLCFMWFYVGSATYITDLNGGDMSKNLYVGQFAAAIALTVSKVAIGIAEPRFEWLGRRVLIIFAQSVAILCYVLILVALYTDQKQSTWYTIVYLSAYCFQALCVETCYLSTIELMPTDVRARVMAITNIIFKAGTTLASLTVPLKDFYEPALFFINLIISATGITVMYLYLDESRNVDLKHVGQQSISESMESESAKSAMSAKSTKGGESEVENASESNVESTK